MRVCPRASIILWARIDAHANVATDWNQTAIRTTEITGVPVPVQTRAIHGLELSPNLGDGRGQAAAA